MLLGGKLRDRVVCYGGAGTPECARERVEEGWPYLRLSVKVRDGDPRAGGGLFVGSLPRPALPPGRRLAHQLVSGYRTALLQLRPREAAVPTLSSGVATPVKR